MLGRHFVKMWRRGGGKPINLITNNGISPNRKRIGKYDDNNNLLEEYESTVEAGLKNNIQRQTISKVCNGNPKYKKAGGFIWKFISDQTLVS